MVERSKGRAWRTWIEGSSKGGMVRRATSLFSMMMLVGSGVALAEVFTGTDGPDTYSGPVPQPTKALPWRMQWRH
jgi:hypothetical protein